MAEVHDRWMAPGPQPNGLQAASDGLWLIDQVDNHLYKLSYDDGSVMVRLATETDRSSGVTVGGGHLWVASTYSCEIFKLNDDGSAVERYDTPGKGIVGFGDKGRTQATGAHGLEWIDDHNMWAAVPPAQKIFLIDPETMEVKRSIPTPGNRPHGIFSHGGALWCADTEMAKIFKLNVDDGSVLKEIEVPDPEVHGMTFHDGNMWFCCATTRRVCTVPLPP